MELTTQVLKPYIGGQMEIQNRREGYLYRGEISAITVEDDELRVRFTWIAKFEEFPSAPSRWVSDDTLDYTIGLDICSANKIGSSDGDKGGDRICLMAYILGETIVLYPADGSKLDPAKVEGLVITK